MECGHNIWKSWKIYKSSSKSFHYSPKYNLKIILPPKIPLTHRKTLFQFALHRDPSEQGYTML